MLVFGTYRHEPRAEKKVVRITCSTHRNEMLVWVLEERIRVNELTLVKKAKHPGQAVSISWLRTSSPEIQQHTMGCWTNEE